MDCFNLEEDEGLSFSVGADENTNNHDQLDTVFEEETQKINSTDSKIVSIVCVFMSFCLSVLCCVCVYLYLCLYLCQSCVSVSVSLSMCRAVSVHMKYIPLGMCVYIFFHQ